MPFRKREAAGSAPSKRPAGLTQSKECRPCPRLITTIHPLHPADAPTTCGNASAASGNSGYRFRPTPRPAGELIRRCHQFAEAEIARWYRYEIAPVHLADEQDTDLDWDGYRLDHRNSSDDFRGLAGQGSCLVGLGSADVLQRRSRGC